MHAMFMLRNGPPSTYLLKATALHQETRAMRENQQNPSHQFAEHLKQCCTHNSERLLHMLANEKDGSNV